MQRVKALQPEWPEWIGHLLLFVKKLEDMAEIAAGALAAGAGVEQILERHAESFPNAPLLDWVADLAGDDLLDFGKRVANLPGGPGRLVPTFKAFGIGAFEEPGGGAPTRAHRSMHSLQRPELGNDFGLAKGVFKLRIVSRFSADGVPRASNISGRLAATASGREECADLAALELIEHTRPAAARRGFRLRIWDCPPRRVNFLRIGRFGGWGGRGW
jgi:hypothetical protein